MESALIFGKSINCIHYVPTKLLIGTRNNGWTYLRCELWPHLTLFFSKLGNSHERTIRYTWLNAFSSDTEVQTVVCLVLFPQVLNNKHFFELQLATWIWFNINLTFISTEANQQLALTVSYTCLPIYIAFLLINTSLYAAVLFVKL